MIKMFIEDRNIKNSIPTALTVLFKHILNCVYQPKIHHSSWEITIRTQTNNLQKDAEHNGYDKVLRIIASNMENSYEKGYDKFFAELNSSDSKSTYTEKEMKSIIPKQYTDIGKDTKYAKYQWTAKNILNAKFIDEFLTDVRNNKEGIY